MFIKFHFSILFTARLYFYKDVKKAETSGAFSVVTKGFNREKKKKKSVESILEKALSNSGVSDRKL